MKRVALDFDHPLNETWPGFLNPHYRECPASCEGGYSWAYRHLREHIGPLLHDREAREDAHYRGILTFLAGQEPSGTVGYCSHGTLANLGKLAGLPDDWDECQVCGGHGIAPEVFEAYEAWSEEEPPAGDGYQVWETVSEGSPITPVLPTAEAMIEWLVANGDGWDRPVSREAAEKFVRGSGWVPSTVMVGGTITTGIESAKLQGDS